MNVYAILMFCLNTKMFTEGLRYFKFAKLPSSSCSDGLRCVLEQYDTRGPRGVKFNPNKGTCDPLPDSWFTSQIQEENNSYFKLMMTEIPIEPVQTKTSRWPFPDHFMVGSSRSVVTYLRLGTIERNGKSQESFSLRFTTIDFIYMMSVRLGQDKVVFNNRYGGRWRYEEAKNSPFDMSNETYKIELRMTSGNIHVYLDDARVPFHTFGRNAHLPASTTVELISRTSMAVFERLQFYYPM